MTVSLGELEQRVRVLEAIGLGLHSDESLQPVSLQPGQIMAAGGLITTTSPTGLTLVNVNVNSTIASGQLMRTTGAGPLTITLPSPVSANQVVGICNACTNGTTVSGSAINGPGLAGATSFPIGSNGNISTVNETVILQSDGTNWNMVQGRQNSGWQKVTNVNASITVSTQAAAAYDLSSRLVGDKVEFRGFFQATAALAASSNLFKLFAGPPNHAPAEQVFFLGFSTNSVGTLLFNGMGINSVGTGLCSNTAAMANGDFQEHDNISFPWKN